jgi:hypothetical protein
VVTYGRELANAMRAYVVGLCGFRWHKVVRQRCSHHANGVRLILFEMMYCFSFSPSPVVALQNEEGSWSLLSHILVNLASER